MKHFQIRMGGPVSSVPIVQLGRGSATAWLLVALVTLGCQKASNPKTEAIQPAKVEKLSAETDLVTITLTEDANRRLGISTAEVTEREITQRRTFGGQAIVPAGKTIVVSSPFAGMVARSKSDEIPIPGTRVEAGTPLLSIKPLLSVERDVMTPAEQVQLVGARANLMAAQTVAAGDVDRGNAEVTGAQISFERAEKLFADRAGARRAVDDAEALLNVAKANLAAAKERETQLRQLLKMLDVTATDGEAATLPMTTPIAGLVNRINVSEGQTIGPGAMLFEIVNTDKIWIRVPIYVDLLTGVQTDQPAKLVSLSGEPLEKNIFATPVAAPPTADAALASADLYYEVDNRELNLRPGQRIGVELPMSKSERSRIVPEGSILYDVYGGTWVYAKTGDRQYTRSRITIRFVKNKEAVLASGPAVGTEVVVDGAAELFGTEFGAGK